MSLPTTKQSRDGRSPLEARILLAGMPKAGKSTLASRWAPDTTLIVDTQRGTTLLEDEHYVAHVSNWAEFEQLVRELTTTQHHYRTVALDLVDDLWTFADERYAGKNAVLASATDDWQRSIKTAEGMFRRTIGQLLASSLGVWFISHTRDKPDGQVTRYVPKLEPRVLTYVQGACEVILLAETLGPKRVLHTQPTEKFEAGSRLPLPEPMEMDARKLYKLMLAGLKAGQPKKPAKPNGKTSNAPQEAQEPPAQVTETPEPVSAGQNGGQQ